MRPSALTLVVLVAATLGGCIHLPPEVAAVVTETDPPATNNFRPDPAVPKAATNSEDHAP